MRRLRVFTVSAGLALASALVINPSLAQPPPATAGGSAEAAGNELQEVTVSASAISIQGYEAPTPVTAVGIQQLQSDARTDIADVLRTLPTFGNSPSPENSEYTGLVSSGVAGEDLLSMRNLGVQRTLVLFDGQRVVDSNIQGGVDTINIPSILIERVDTVTGGASAVWGSDALAGVVNLIINKNFNGVQVNLEDSNNSQNLHQQYKAEVAFGTPFADGAGHFEVAGSYWDIPRPYFTSDVQGWASPRLVSNPACSNYFLESATCPAGQPIWQHATNVGLATETPGGIIDGAVFTNPATGAITASTNALTNTAFGPGAQPYAFNPGNVSEDFFSNGGTLNDEKGYIGINAQPLKNETAFALVSWKFNDAVSASLQLNYGHTETMNNSYTADQYGSANIYSGNPYIPASIQSQMNALGVNTLQMGTTNDNNTPGGGGSFQSQANTLSIPVNDIERTLTRGVFTLYGAIGSKWTWNAYFMHGESHMYQYMWNNSDIPNLIEAENAVLVTPANVGNTGLPLGSITCAANLNNALLAKTNPLAAANAFVPGAAPGCQPLDIFGIGVASQPAINYVTGQSRGGLEFQSMSLFENVASGKIEGELPFGTSAGAVAAAFGVVYRNESAININCGVNCTDVNFNVGNFAAFAPNGYNIKEASAEFNAPLLKDQGLKSLSVDAAYRVSDYSTSGTVSTYKFGVISQMVDAVRLRASYSYDIRAPNLSELFAEPLPVLGAITNPRTGLSTSFYSLTEGNRNLLPEIGETRSLGLVFTPVQGLTASVDWYYILIKQAINEGLGASTEIAQCAAGVSSFCELITWGHYPGAGGCTGPTLNSCASTVLAAVATPPVNSDRETTSGLDFNGDYRLPAWGGALDFNTVMNYMFSQHYQSIGVNCDAAGGLSFDEYFYCPINGVPKFRGTVAGTYATGPWLATIQTRLIGAAHLVENWQSGVQVDDNDVPFIDYWDVRLSYKFGVGVTLYGAVDNVLNKTMPTIPATPVSITIFDAPYRDDIYDGFGRVFRVGIRAKF